MGDLLSGTCYYRDVVSMRETLPFIRAIAGDTSSSKTVRQRAVCL